MKWIAVLLGILLLVGSVSAVTYGYASVYPPAQNVTYVNATSSHGGTNYYPWNATNPNSTLTGVATLNAWTSTAAVVTSQRFHIDLGNATPIGRVYYENYHHMGTLTNDGAKDFTFWGSNSSGSFLNRTYTNDTGWTSIPVTPTSFAQHAASDTVDPKYITVTTPNFAFRYYALKIGYNYGGSDFVGLRRVELQKPISWIYTTPGTYYWVCPGNVTSISVNVGGGGGSGKGAYFSGGSWIGYGGSTGEWKNYASVSVTPGTNYTIVVGDGGAASAASAVSNAGSLSSGFTYTAVGGAGGLSLPAMTNANGGNGANGFLVGGNAAAGGVSSGYTGGLAGSGYSAGGGGGAATSGGVLGAGGKGSDGYVGITQIGYSTLNIPDFVGTPTTGIAGTLVTFTDTSTIVDNVNMTYLWDFGDGVTSSTIGNVVHVFPYVGSYTVKLTIHTDLGDVTEEKEAYINLVNEDPGKINTLYPREVSFTLVDKYGYGIADLPVTVTMASSSVENTNWLTSMFGLSDSSINSTVLSDTTDSSGQVVFPMIASGRYHMTFIDLSRGVNEARDVHPSQTNYIYILSTSATAIAEASSDSINISLSTSPPASAKPTNVYLIANYTDLSGTTSVINFVVRHPSNGTVVYTATYTAQNSLNVSYTVPNTMATAYVWELNATTIKFGKQSKAMGITLPGSGANGLASNLFKEGCTNWKCD